MMSCLRAVNVRKLYHAGRPDETCALDQVSVTIDAGEVVVLAGPSGSGKTTLLSLLGCMARPTSGEVFLGERSVGRLQEHFLARLRREHFGFVFQQYQLLGGLSVLDNVMLPLYPAGMALSKIRLRAEELLDRFELRDKKHKTIAQLSGGEQQRVAISRALIADPRVLIADEPTAHLDQELAGRLLAHLAELKAEGKTILIASHDPSVINAGLIDRQVLLRHGQLETGER